MFILIIISLILIVGTFYKIGSSRSKFQGYFWATCTLLLWFATNYIVIKPNIIVPFIIVFSIQAILLDIEMK
ncbi:MAG: hypothetical protein CR982_07945 [Candidatus Cloacimonadota bacterium]|nr:MAG: hypothetical protein CR982_07945 [Candidatus Cloacimonadota bacterium]PIE77610.1 MAG: hypothetical protein CSA15_11845 [Candidatus Delongbacteria bacterium]